MFNLANEKGQEKKKDKNRDRRLQKEPKTQK